MGAKMERTCLACRAKHQQSDMLRIAKCGDEVLIDVNHKLDGRGAYICDDEKCVALVIKKKLLNRAFKANIKSEVYENLQRATSNN